MDANTEKYLKFLNAFHSQLDRVQWTELIEQPEKTALISVDMINGFCHTGNLASERVAALINPVVDLFNLAWNHGVQDYVLLHDCHTHTAEEFKAFAEHSICGTVEAEAVDEIRSLSFFPQIRIIEKNSIHPAHATGFDQWLAQANHLNTYIVVGDCTDLCVYQIAMYLRTFANAYDLTRRVIIPENCVNTYDLPVDLAASINVQPHPGDLMHRLFLHHMKLNGVEIYSKII